MVKSLRSGLILSTLLLWTSQQVGTTFGEYTSVSEDNSEIKACRVFPSQIESQLSLLAEHLERAVSLKGRLVSVTVIPAAYDPSATDSVYAGGDSSGSEIESGFEASSRLEAAADGLAERIGELNAMIQQLEQQKALNQSIWQELQQEIAAASVPIHELLTSLNELEPNCAELSQTTLLDRITGLLDQHGLHSGPLGGTLQEILNYLRSVHQLGLTASDGVEADSDAAVAFAQPFHGRTIDGDLMGEELLAYFESVQASLQSAIDGLTTDISSLEEQRAQLLAEAEEQRLAEIERLKQLQEEQAKQEEQAGEEDPVAPDETENPSDGTTPPPGDEQPATDETPGGGQSPTAGETDNGDVQTPVDGDDGGDSADENEDEHEDEDKQSQADSADADAAPSSANDSEGGE
ncbi:hypothetical protein [Paenibacillus sp. TH7-28]